MSAQPAVPESAISAADVVEFIESGGAKSFAIVVEDPSVIAARIDAQILSASSVEELFGEREVIHARDYLNKPFRLLDVEWRPSSIEGEGLPFFAVMHIANMDGEPAVLTTGARSVLLKVAKAQKEGWLPLEVRIVQSEKKTENGYQPLDLMPAPGGF
jgi:hypothetical protein